MISALKCWQWAAVVFAAVSAATAEGREEAPPNILIVMTDDQGYGDVALHGNPDVDTDHIDALARESVWLNSFTAQPVCAPSRACLMTGQHHLRVGVWGVHGGRDYLNLGVPTLASMLAEAGYTTGFAGKWHLGKTPAYLPYRRGFQEAWTITQRLYQHTDPVLDYNGSAQRPTGWTAEILTDLALSFIDQCERDTPARPWMFYLAHPYIHEPYIAPPERIQKHLDRGHSASYAALCAMTEHLDSEVGRLLEGIEERGLDRETIVIFLGDNGPIGNPTNLPALTDEEMARRNPLGLRGNKGQLFDNGLRVPAYFRWTGRWEARRSDATSTLVDVVPTLLDVVGLEPPTGIQLDGVSLLPVLRGLEDQTPERSIVYANHEVHWPGRDRLYSFLHDKEGMRFEDQHLAISRGKYKYIQAWGPAELYQTSNDTHEVRDRSAEMEAVVNRLQNELESWWTELHEAPGTYDMPFIVIGGDAGALHSVMLPGAAPTRIHGGLTTSSHSVDGWNTLDQSVTWAVQIKSPGVYRVSLKGQRGAIPGAFTISAGSRSVELTSEDAGSVLLEIAPDVEQITLSLSGKHGEGVVIDRLWGLALAPEDRPAAGESNLPPPALGRP